MRLGLDFDNTIISYDQLFLRVAVEKGLAPESVSPHKNAVRDYLRRVNKEEEWTRLQGEVYGGRILEAAPYDGMFAALRVLSDSKIPVNIVSHKTRTPILGEPCDLHAAARGWLVKQGFHDADGLAWANDQIFFELTKEAKVTRILSLGCTHYVDDLPEILDMLPLGILKILFSPNKEIHVHPEWTIMSSWAQLPTILHLK